MATGGASMCRASRISRSVVPVACRSTSCITYPSPCGASWAGGTKIASCTVLSWPANRRLSAPVSGSMAASQRNPGSPSAGFSPGTDVRFMTPNRYSLVAHRSSVRGNSPQQSVSRRSANVVTPSPPSAAACVSMVQRDRYALVFSGSNGAPEMSGNQGNADFSPTGVSMCTNRPSSNAFMMCEANRLVPRYHRTEEPRRGTTPRYTSWDPSHT